jgi:hypothetical protein
VSIDLANIYWSYDWRPKEPNNASGIALLRMQLVRETDPAFGADHDWIRLTHLYRWNNDVKDLVVHLHIVGPTDGNDVLAASSADFAPPSANGLVTIKVPHLQRGFTEEVSVPKAARINAVHPVSVRTSFQAQPSTNYTLWEPRENSPAPYRY